MAKRHGNIFMGFGTSKPSTPVNPVSVPVSYYTMDTGSGTTAFDSVGSNDGSIVGATWTTGKINDGLSFDGVNDRVKSTLNFTQSGSISLWFTADVFGSGGYIGSNLSNNALLSDDIAGYIWVSSGANGEIKIYLYDTAFKISTITGLSTGTFYNLIITWNTSNYFVYLDGVQQATGTFTGLSNLTSGLSLGTPYNNNRFWDGIIDEVGIWNQTLTQEQITYLYNSGNGARPPFS